MKRTFVIDESKAMEYMRLVFESVDPKAEQVQNIRKYLDKNFIRNSLNDITADGKLTQVGSVMQLTPDGQIAKQMSMEQFLSFLDDKYNGLIKDKRDRREFLKQVIRDWYYKRIDRNGLLSVNHIN